MLVDNAGGDIVLGMTPIVRDLLTRGTSVVISANTLPALNDVTHDELVALMDQVATIDPIIDQIMQGWVPANDGSPGDTPNRGINDIKAFVDARRANVLSQIPQNYSLTVTGNAADSPEGYKVTGNGAATFSGSFTPPSRVRRTLLGLRTSEPSVRRTRLLMARFADCSRRSPVRSH